MSDLAKGDLARWLDVGSEAKAESVIALAPPDVRTVIEIGCGTGAVLGSLDRHGFADRYWACEPEESLYAQIQSDSIKRLVDTSMTTLDRAFGTQVFDLAILSHVAEHLLTPAVLVAEALRRARYVIVEVPLDDNLAGRARSCVRGLFGHVRLQNAAGHVQFFSRRSARDLVRFAGGNVLADRGYFPYAATAALPPRLYRKVILQLARIEAVGRMYHEHYAMLAQRATIETWSHHYHEPV